MKPEKTKNLLSALGLCRRAGKAVFGTEQVLEAMRTKGVLLVLAPNDNAENTQKKLRDKCRFYQTPLEILPVGGEDLAQAVGKSGHTAAMAITDKNFVILIRKNLSESPDAT